MNLLTKRMRNLAAIASGVLVLGLACTAVASAGTSAPGGHAAYDSMTVSSNYVWSQGFTAPTGITQLGNDVTLLAGGKLDDVVVSMGNFNAASASASLPITLNIYNPNGNLGEPGNGVAPGSLITSVTVNVTPPGTTNGFSASAPPTYGIDNFNVTFNFQGKNITLPTEVVYGIAYDNTTVDTGLNVNYSYDSSSVPSVGADTYPGYLFVATNGTNSGNADIGGSTGQVTCQNVSTAFEQYSTQPSVYGSNACGLAALPVGPGLLVPAVEFTTG
jgi:hypothetical protein